MGFLRAWASGVSPFEYLRAARENRKRHSQEARAIHDQWGISEAEVPQALSQMVEHCLKDHGSPSGWGDIFDQVRDSVKGYLELPERAMQTPEGKLLVLTNWHARSHATATNPTHLHTGTSTLQTGTSKQAISPALSRQESASAGGGLWVPSTAGRASLKGDPQAPASRLRRREDP